MESAAAKAEPRPVQQRPGASQVPIHNLNSYHASFQPASFSQPAMAAEALQRETGTAQTQQHAGAAPHFASISVPQQTQSQQQARPQTVQTPYAQLPTHCYAPYAPPAYLSQSRTSEPYVPNRKDLNVGQPFTGRSAELDEFVRRWQSAIVITEQLALGQGRQLHLGIMRSYLKQSLSAAVETAMDQVMIEVAGQQRSVLQHGTLQQILACLKQQYGDLHQWSLKRELRAGQHPFTGNSGDEFRLWIDKTVHNCRSVDISAAEVPSVLLNNLQGELSEDLELNTPREPGSLPSVIAIRQRGTDYLALKSKRKTANTAPLQQSFDMSQVKSALTAAVQQRAVSQHQQSAAVQAAQAVQCINSSQQQQSQELPHASYAQCDFHGDHHSFEDDFEDDLWD